MVTNQNDVAPKSPVLTWTQRFFFFFLAMSFGLSFVSLVWYIISPVYGTANSMRDVVPIARLDKSFEDFPTEGELIWKRYDKLNTVYHISGYIKSHEAFLAWRKVLPIPMPPHQRVEHGWEEQFELSGRRFKIRVLAPENHYFYLVSF